MSTAPSGAHRKLAGIIRRGVIAPENCAQLIADSEARAVEAATKQSEADIMQVITERDAAEDIADRLTSGILGEEIDWPFHDAKWQEAIEAIQNMVQSLTAARKRVCVLEGVLKAALDPLQELADDEQTFWGVGNPIAQQSQKIYEDAKAALAANDAKEGSG